MLLAIDVAEEDGVSVSGDLSPQARAEVEAELERRRKARRSRLGIGSALAMSVVALGLSIVSFVDRRDETSKASVEVLDQRMDDIDEYTRPLSGDISRLRQRIESRDEALVLVCDGLQYLTSLSVADGRTAPGGLPLQLEQTCPR